MGILDRLDFRGLSGISHLLPRFHMCEKDSNQFLLYAVEGGR